ncbi:MAG TPA: glycosyltransferase family 4 protein, partial [Chloroflexota bacterium]|nr:glycosyltransferase family 4 protein [Chloroflexota bacterium]
MSEQQLHIAYVTSHYLPSRGGIEQVVMQLATRMAARGHHVEVLTQTYSQQLPRHELTGGVIVRRFIASGHFAVAPMLLAHLLRHRNTYDLVHAHNYHALPALSAALSRPRVLVVSPHYHGTGHTVCRRLLHVLYRVCGHAIFRCAAAVICVSEAEATLVCRHFGRSLPRVQVIGNGVETAELRAAVSFPKVDTVVLSVGRLERYKQTRRLIEAISYLEARFVLRIVGEGPERRQLEALSARLGLEQRVLFLGRLADPLLARWFRTASVYVNLSRLEAFGITVIEALCAGSCVVASDIPAFREHAQRMGSDRMVLVPPDAPPAMVALAIQQAAQRAALVAPLPDTALPSWDGAIEETMCIYRQLTA